MKENAWFGKVCKERCLSQTVKKIFKLFLHQITKP